MRQLIERIRMKLLIRRLRNNLEWFGYDVNHLTDEEFVRRLTLAGQHAARAANEAAVSVEQMGNAFRQVGKAFAEALEGEDA